MKRLLANTILAVLALACGLVLTGAAARGGGAAATNWAVVYAADHDVKGLSHTDLFISTANGSVTRQLTNDTFFKGQPIWSPDGTRIAFVSMQVASRGDNGTGGIYSIKPDGTGLTLLFDFSSSPGGLTFDDSSARDLAWSPDGKYIVFAGWGADGCHLHLLDVASGAVRSLTPVSNIVDARAPAWSHVLYSDAAGSHSRISFAGYDGGNNAHDLMVLDVTIVPTGALTTGALTNLTNSPNDQEWGSSWSPDGQFITFFKSTPTDQGLFKMRADGTDTPVKVGTVSYVSWSPVGGYWAYLGPGGTSGNPTNDIFHSRTDFTGAAHLTNTSKVNERFPDWNPAWVNDL